MNLPSFLREPVNFPFSPKFVQVSPIFDNFPDFSENFPDFLKNRVCVNFEKNLRECVNFENFLRECVNFGSAGGASSIVLQLKLKTSKSNISALKNNWVKIIGGFSQDHRRYL